MKAKQIISVYVIVIICCLTACNSERKDPLVNESFIVSDLSEEEFAEVGTTELSNAVRDDFKKLDFTLDVSHSKYITNRKIYLPNLKKLINSYDNTERYWYGSSSKEDNSNQNFAHYTSEIVIYSKGLNEKDLKKMFEKASFLLRYHDKNGEEKSIKQNLY